MSGRKGTASTLETWRNGPMGFDWEDLNDAQCDAKSDEMLHRHAIEFHRGHPPESIPASIRKELDDA